ncbi:MAG: protoheme IX farnesyltransferase [Firmicutes bacterium]|nr:protoheme IX farnesyltransferase [Bacillota bacterium]
MLSAHPVSNRSPWRALHDFWLLTKPSIMLLILITGFTTLLVASEGIPPVSLTLAAMIGMALASGSANALNCYIDRDIDAIMTRTRNRPLPAGRLAPSQALVFGIVLGIGAFAVLAAHANLLSASIALGGILFYVLVYTLGLKRRTPQNIVIGGAAGAVPPLIAWAAVTGTVEWPAVLLFAIIFLWTPPHFWSLALLSSADYDRAGVPMMPVVRGEEETRRQIVAYAALLIPATAGMYLVGFSGLFFLISGLALGFVFLWKSWNLLRTRTREAAKDVFLFSVYYLGLVFLALVIDRLVL